MGSPAIAAWIAHAAFWTLAAIGIGSGELGPRGVAIVLALWLAGFVGRAYVPQGGLLFAPFVALLDMVLVLIVFKGDVKIR